MNLKRRIILFFFCFLFFFISSQGIKKTRKKSGQDSLVTELLKGYTKQDPPSPDRATKVELGIEVNSFYSISEATMDYQLSFYLQQRWLDPRLGWYNKSSVKLKKIKLGDGMWTQLWIPDTFFRNEKKANFHDVTVANRMLRLDENGSLWYVTKISATFSCPMTLQKYPLDTQKCPISIESFGYTNDTMYFAWLDNNDGKPPVRIGEHNKQLPQFTLVDHKLSDCTQTYVAGTFPCLEVRFELRRDIGFFLIQVYVPSILIVILSWVSFWINIESSPARVSIGLLTVLTTTTMSAAARASLPRVSYIKAIDVWMIICLIFVFASLIEYAVVNVMSRKQPSKKNSPPPPAAAAAAGPQQATTGENKLLCARPKCIKGADGKSTESDGKRKARNIDKLSRQCFPLAFVLFNVVYWTVYTIPSETTEDSANA